MTDIEPPSADIAPLKKWKRRFERGTPKGALIWKNAKQRSRLMFSWQGAIMQRFPRDCGVVRIAWAIFTLSQKEGFAYATDGYLGAHCGISINKVQAMLATLEKAGAIVRASCFVDGKPQRRIWPSAQIIPPVTGGIHTPRHGTQDTPRHGGRDSIRKKPTPKTVRISTTAAAARRDAERRQQRRAPPADEDLAAGEDDAP